MWKVFAILFAVAVTLVTLRGLINYSASDSRAIDAEFFADDTLTAPDDPPVLRGRGDFSFLGMFETLDPYIFGMFDTLEPYMELIGKVVKKLRIPATVEKVNPYVKPVEPVEPVEEVPDPEDILLSENNAAAETTLETCKKLFIELGEELVKVSAAHSLKLTKHFITQKCVMNFKCEGLADYAKRFAKHRCDFSGDGGLKVDDYFNVFFPAADQELGKVMKIWENKKQYAGVQEKIRDFATRSLERYLSQLNVTEPGIQLANPSSNRKERKAELTRAGKERASGGIGYNKFIACNNFKLEMRNPAISYVLESLEDADTSEYDVETSQAPFRARYVFIKLIEELSRKYQGNQSETLEKPRAWYVLNGVTQENPHAKLNPGLLSYYPKGTPVQDIIQSLRTQECSECSPDEVEAHPLTKELRKQFYVRFVNETIRPNTRFNRGQRKNGEFTNLEDFYKYVDMQYLRHVLPSRPPSTGCDVVVEKIEPVVQPVQASGSSARCHVRVQSNQSNKKSLDASDFADKIYYHPKVLDFLSLNNPNSWFFSHPTNTQKQEPGGESISADSHPNLMSYGYTAKVSNGEDDKEDRYCEKELWRVWGERVGRLQEQQDSLVAR